MTINQMTHRQGQALARFIATLRPDWDTPGIEDALGRARELAPCGDLAIAAIKAAGNPAARTPAIIGMEGPHWRGAEHKPQRRFEASRVCAICSQSPEECARRWHDDHEFLAVDRARGKTSVPPPEEIRAVLGSPELCRHGVARDHCAEHDPRRNQARDAIRTTPQPAQVAGAEIEESL
jgi:hypothetical protein